MKAELAKSRGMLCFSKDWHNPVQWSHYADSHRGICLGFEVLNPNLVQVSYTRKRLVAEVEKFEKLDEATMLRFLTAKYSHWKYENEWRCFLRLEQRDADSSFYFAKFSEQLRLVQVIVGARSSITRRTLLESLGEIAPDVAISKARLAFRSFRVVRQRNERLWS